MRLLQRLLVFAMLPMALIVQPTTSRAGFGISISIAPPPLPVYLPPPLPGPDYLWSPGYWAYDDDDADYYWVPGTWVRAPEPGLLWTPGYWGWRDGFYAWNAGYWGPHIGYYGGINYGCGYGGYGYDGGHWSHGSFYYNTAVVQVNKTIIHNTYNKTVIVNNNTTINRVSFNGGNGGTTARPSPQELAAAHDKHIAATALQTQHEHAARSDRALFASVNHGAPAVAATAKPGVFTGHGITATKAAKINHAPGTPGKLATHTPLPQAHAMPKEHATLNGAKQPSHPTALKSVTPPHVKTAGAVDHRPHSPNQMHANLAQQHRAVQHRPPPHHSEQHAHAAPKRSAKPERKS